jgi:ferredoxin
VYRHVTGRTLLPDAVTMHVELPGYRRERGYEAIRRAELPTVEAAERLADPDTQVELVLDERAARREAQRCLDCGVTPIFDGTRCVLCGGCVDVCPTACLKLVPVADTTLEAPLDFVAAGALGDLAPDEPISAILKDEDRCIRCALCAARCPTEAIAMERYVAAMTWSTA